MQNGRTACVCLAILLALFVFGACADKPAALDVRALCVAQGGAQPSASDFLTDEAQRACAEQGIAVTFAAAPDFSAHSEIRALLWKYLC